MLPPYLLKGVARAPVPALLVSDRGRRCVSGRSVRVTHTRAHRYKRPPKKQKPQPAEAEADRWPDRAAGEGGPCRNGCGRTDFGTRGRPWQRDRRRGNFVVADNATGIGPKPPSMGRKTPYAWNRGHSQSGAEQPIGDRQPDQRDSCGQ